MPDSRHEYGSSAIVDLVHDTVVPDAEPIRADVGELHHAVRPRLLSELCEPTGHTLVERRREAVEIALCGRLDLNAIRGHGHDVSARA